MRFPHIGRKNRYEFMKHRRRNQFTCVITIPTKWGTSFPTSHCLIFTIQPVPAYSKKMYFPGTRHQSIRFMPSPYSAVSRLTAVILIAAKYLALI
jgi:hypothetical protein